MPPGERLVDDLADAILDGSPIDWAAAESSSDGTAQLLVTQLRVLAAVAASAREEHGRASAFAEASADRRSLVRLRAKRYGETSPELEERRRGGGCSASLDEQRVIGPISIAMYPEMASLRGDACFAAIRRKLGLP